MVTMKCRQRVVQGLFLFVIAVFVSVPVHAAKPGGGGGGGGPTSVIVFVYNPTRKTVDDAMYQMYQDGSGKTQILPKQVIGRPSSRVYSGSRWFLTMGVDPNTNQEELFAFRNDGTTVQLTACAAGGVYLGNIYSMPQWSNDFMDAFVTTDATADRDLDGALDGNYLVRLPIVGDIGAMLAADVLPRTAADVEFVPDPPPAGTATQFSPARYSWSGDNSTLAYLVDNYGTDGKVVSGTFWLRHFPADGPAFDVPIYTGSNLALVPWSFSHDSTRLAFATRNTSTYGGVWTIKVDGTGLRQVVRNSGTTNYNFQGWSPNSGELLVGITKTSIEISKYQYQLARLPAVGGSLTILTGDLVSTGYKYADGNWFPLP